MLRKTGGVKLPHLKATENEATVNLPLSKVLTVPMSQSMGAPCDCLVKKGDTVTMGMLSLIHI